MSAAEHCGVTMAMASRECTVAEWSALMWTFAFLGTDIIIIIEEAGQ